MKPRDYCCCAIPTVNAGIYLTLLEQLTLGVVAGTLTIATPHIVGAAKFTAFQYIFTIIAYAAAATQILGFIGVHQERSILYRRYTTLHLLLTLAGFSIAAVWIILSATRHSQSKSACETDFFSNSTSTSLGDTLCNIFPWVDVGLMGGLWVLLAIAQTYFYVVISSYGSGQRLDHEKYDSMYDPTRPLTSDIPLSNRDPWDARPSDDNLARGGYHDRQMSTGSYDQGLGDKSTQPQYGYGYAGSAYPPAQPGNAYTQDPAPTPRVNDPYYAQPAAYNYEYGNNMQRPPSVQAHPAEGSFKRKTPRVGKPLSEDFRVPS